MDEEQRLRKRQIAKFEPYIKFKRSIFTPKKRGQLLGIHDLPGRPQTTIDFWYDIRNLVKTALLDLELFIEMADKDQVNQTLTEKTLMPVVKALLWHPILDEAPPDPNRAKIAKLFIEYGFKYLSKGAAKVIKRTIIEAIDLSNYLALNVQTPDTKG